MRLIAALLLAAAPAAADPIDATILGLEPAGESVPLLPIKSLSGYVKELWQYSLSPLDRRPYFISLSRARLSADLEAGPFRGRVDYDHVVHAGSYFRTLQHRQLGLGDPSFWLDMDHTISTSATHDYRHGLHRGWIGIEGEPGFLRFGRQRVAWGTGRLWNPTDVISPYVPTAVEREERPGADVVHGRLSVSELTQGEIVWAPEATWPRQALLARAKSNRAGFDWSLAGGKIAGSTGSWLIGGDIAGDILDSTVYAEWSYSDPRSLRPSWKAVVGLQRGLPPDAKPEFLLKDATIIVEYFHNGSGASTATRYDPRRLLGGREIALGKDYVGGSYSRELHPLVKAEVNVIANLNDMSHFAGPSLQWNALNNLYLTGGLQRYAGARVTEFGRSPNLGYLQAQFFF